MAIIIEKNKDGEKQYKGFLSSEQTRKADELLEFLQKEIPEYGQKLNAEYGDSVLYKYYLGKHLSELLDEYDINDEQRVYFWNEIKDFAADKERARQDGGEAKTRKFYEQCYNLSQLDISIVEKLSWRQWQDLFDRTKNREDSRIFNWIGFHEPKIKEKDWRSFEKGLNSFLRNKDTSVFEDQELFDIYEMLLTMAQVWQSEFTEFQQQYPKSAKIKSKAKWEGKYIDLCLKCRKANKRNLDKDDCLIVFNTLMKL